MKSQHTPGPWKAQGNKVTAIDHDHRFVIASCATRGQFKHTQEGEENNARLIAAAPELLEALHRLLIEYRALKGLDDDEATNLATAALQKAKGEA